MTCKTRIAALASILMMTAAPAAFAAGTDAGTSISNSIDISYESGGETVTVTDADTATFVVDRRVDFSLVSQDAGRFVSAPAGASDQVLTFLLTNEGNAASGYDIDITTAGPSAGTLGLTYDTDDSDGVGHEGTYYTVLSTDASFDAGDTFIDLTGDLNDVDLPEDGQIYLLVVANTPGNTADREFDTFGVTATALDSGTTTVTTATPSGSMALGVEDTILADQGRDGVENEFKTLQITAPQLSFSKTVVIVDENVDGTLNASGCASATIDPSAAAAIPGACLEYTITVTNDAAATSPASNLVITDQLPAENSYASHTTGGFTDVQFDNGTGPAGTVTGTLSTLAAGDSASFTVRVLID